MVRNLLLEILIFITLMPSANASEWLSDEYFIDTELPQITPIKTEELAQKRDLAEKNEDAETLYILARMYSEGIEVQIDKIKAEKLFQKSSELGLEKAQLALGIFYNFKGDITKSKKWFLQAARSGNEVAMFQLGYFYEKGRGVFENYKKAISYYEKSSEAGYLKATLRLALIHHHGDEPELKKAIIYYKKAASQASDDEKLKISILLARLYTEIAKDQDNHEQIFKWTMAAAKLGDVESQLSAASKYLNGIGTEVNYDKAIEWYNKAASNGNTDAMTMLGYIYSNGIGTAINIEDALKWYKYAAERGNDEAAWNLGYMYSAGIGVERSEKEAEKWFDRAKSLRVRKPNK